VELPLTAKLLPLRRLQGKPEELSDAALVAATAVGEQAALGCLFDRYHRSVYHFLSRCLGAGGADLDDFVQTTFLFAQEAAGRYRGQSSVRGWLLGIAAHVAHRQIRSEVRRRRMVAGLTAVGPPPQRAVDDQVSQQQQLTKLQTALAALPADLRVAFILCEIEELPGVEAARVLNIRQGTLWRRLHEARKALRVALEGTS
jgi:RNA polymerase sigma-70 factor (ECF subfamily)